jgi:hypothetical protein
LIIGNKNAITYKEIFKLIKENKMWIGRNNGPKTYVVPPTYTQKNIEIKNGIVYTTMGNTGWFTNLNVKKRYENLILVKRYTTDEYPKYDNYEAIEVSKVAEIPQDYFGVMVVPITFLDKYNPEQFEIIGIDRYVEDNPHYGHRFKIKGKEIYARILIRRKQ